uniref:Secreted protein n=1 Tax=Panagrellus redivivus TaxID=6233 RepID=A0A7E4W2S9_PANRE
MRFQVDLLAVRILAFAISVATVNGYILGQLITVRTSPALNSDSDNGYEPMRTPFLAVADSLPQRIDDSELAAPPYASRPVPLQKKSKKQADPGFLKLKSSVLRKFNGSGSRNCFFTPIQCMIQHDMSKYKKLVDNNMEGYGSIAKRPKFAYPLQD